MSATNKDLALSIIHYLRKAVANKEIGEDYAESLDVAIDCIADAFEIDKDQDTVVVKDVFHGKSLKELVDAGLKSASSATTVESSSASTTASTEDSIDSADNEEKANQLKLEGNKAMAAKDFAAAISKYSEALELTPKNAVFLSNRAAAYSQAGKYELAIKDAEAAIEVDSTFAKAYSRLGLAKYASGNAKGAMEAYKKGLEVEGDKKSDAMTKGYETAKRRVEEELESSMDDDSTNNTNSRFVSERSTLTSNDGTAHASATASTSTGGAPGGMPAGMPDFSSMFGGAGGMPNFSELMNNPQIMQAAQDLMSNPGALEGLMNNPALRNMANQFMGGNGGAGAGSNN